MVFGSYLWLCKTHNWIIFGFLDSTSNSLRFGYKFCMFRIRNGLRKHIWSLNFMLKNCLRVWLGFFRNKIKCEFKLREWFQNLICIINNNRSSCVCKGRATQQYLHRKGANKQRHQTNQTNENYTWTPIQWIGCFHHSCLHLEKLLNNQLQMASPYSILHSN